MVSLRHQRSMSSFPVSFLVVVGVFCLLPHQASAASSVDPADYKAGCSACCMSNGTNCTMAYENGPGQCCGLDKIGFACCPIMKIARCDAVEGFNCRRFTYGGSEFGDGLIALSFAMFALLIAGASYLVYRYRKSMKMPVGSLGSPVSTEMGSLAGAKSAKAWKNGSVSEESEFDPSGGDHHATDTSETMSETHSCTLEDGHRLSGARASTTSELSFEDERRQHSMTSIYSAAPDSPPAARPWETQRDHTDIFSDVTSMSTRLSVTERSHHRGEPTPPTIRRPADRYV
eukprot:GFYU01000074.1.p1 GENE.GFYU01000074.1~~GFYU01000074.1.p1  ORF type:complete len:307 (+),score=22.61 GFYU01000074.1:58-921(+)